MKAYFRTNALIDALPGSSAGAEFNCSVILGCGTIWNKYSHRCGPSRVPLHFLHPKSFAQREWAKFLIFRRFPSSVSDPGLTRNNRRKGRRSLIARAASAGAPQDLSSAETEIYADGAAQPIVPSRLSVYRWPRQCIDFPKNPAIQNKNPTASCSGKSSHGIAAPRTR